MDVPMSFPYLYSAPSPACGGRLGWGQSIRGLSGEMLHTFAPTPALPRMRGRELIAIAGSR